jgi:hypothetical protein
LSCTGRLEKKLTSEIATQMLLVFVFGCVALESYWQT